MRIICTLNDQSKGRLLSTFLTGEGIDNQLEIITNTDWGSSNYGDSSCRIWVYDEDQVPAAMQWLETFQKDPNNPVFKKVASSAPPIIPIVLPAETPSPPEHPKRTSTAAIQKNEKTSLTTYLLLICCILFFIDASTAPMVKSIPNYLPTTPLLSSTLKKQTLYDYPKAYEIVDKLVSLYGIEKLKNPQDLPPEGQILIREFQSTPIWQGFYTQSLSHRTPEKTSKTAPWFEKISQGEVWRLFSPCLMHNDILHLLFNMLWLIVLGKQIEQRLHARKYMLLILLAGIFSNTCQYLMSGANFIGFSGILCAMLTFIWMRQKIAPWEAYPLEKSTIIFMMVFIMAMFSIQLILYYLETSHQMFISLGIANTAHLTGAAMGAFLGSLPFFAWKTK